MKKCLIYKFMVNNKCLYLVVVNKINKRFWYIAMTFKCHVYSLASAMPPDVTANVASFSGRSGL